LTKIGKLRARDDLLDSLLAPSRRVEAKYATYVAQTVDGLVMTGLLVSRDEGSLVIRDNEGRETKVKPSQVEEIRPSPTSLMPEGQMASLTAQQAADLIEYLATRQ
jgi:putative heme-binding domain-containing protein